MHVKHTRGGFFWVKPINSKRSTPFAPRCAGPRVLPQMRFWWPSTSLWMLLDGASRCRARCCMWSGGYSCAGRMGGRAPLAEGLLAARVVCEAQGKQRTGHAQCSLALPCFTACSACRPAELLEHPRCRPRPLLPVSPTAGGMGGGGSEDNASGEGGEGGVLELFRGLSVRMVRVWGVVCVGV